MRRLVLAVLLAFLSLSRASSAAVLTPDLAQRAAALAAGDSISVILDFSDRVDLSRFHGRRSEARDLITSLRDRAETSQAHVRALLASRGFAGRFQAFWISNSIVVRVPIAMLDELGRLPELERIEYDTPIHLVDDGPNALAPAVAEWNLTMIGADQVWAQYGLDGTGIVVGSMDTGFDPNHPALLGKWRGGTNSWKDCFNSLPNPYDDHGHGTHTIGTMVGGDGPGPFNPDIGVAYNARFISAKVIGADNTFSGSGTVLNGAQFMLDPDGNPATDDFPDVVNNSWLFSTQNSALHASMDAWLAAGIIPVFAAGNNGPTAGTVTAPGSYDNTIAVAATDNGDVIAGFSSRGPAPPGVGFSTDKPEIAAPGAGVLSCLPGGFYGSWSGTSMATPHVTGTIALMLQAHPGMTEPEIRAALFETAVDHGAPGFDFDYGFGRLDAFAAVSAALGPSLHLAAAVPGHDVQLSWNTVPALAGHLTGFEVYRSPIIHDYNSASLLGTTLDSSFTDHHRFGLFYYRLRALRDNGPAMFTNEIAVTACGMSAPDRYAAGAVTTSPVAADFNGDGRLDLVVANTLATGTVKVLAGDGAGHFGAAASFASGSRPFGIATGDWNGDGIADLAVTNDLNSGTVSILRGNGASGVGNGTFTAPVAYAASTRPEGIVCEDFDADGILDLAVAANGINLVAILRGNGAGGVGNGTFAAPVTYPAGIRPIGIVSADFDHDGVLDLATANNGGGTVSILLGHETAGRPDGTFDPAVAYVCGGGPQALATGDFDADGIVDLAVTRNVDPGIVTIVRGVGDGTFAVGGSYPAGSTLTGIAAADLNGDGITDLCVAGGPTLSVLLGTGSGGVGDGGLEAAVPIDGGASPADLAIADFNADGKADIVVTNTADAQNIGVLRASCGSDVGTALTLLSPNGGEDWPGSIEQAVQWTKGPGVISVDVDVSRDNGAHWRRIGKRRVGTSMLWMVTDPISAPGAARVRVSDSRLNTSDVSDAGFTISPDARLDAPGDPPARLALAIAVENPAIGRLRVRYTLPDRRAATVELLDVSGRRVSARALEPVPGTRTIELANGLRPGVYLVRLSHDGRRINAKAVVLR